ncbi:N-acetyltransferase [Rhizorhabdus wittichii DC-6]|nr:N-acetyltransferase [Rhizorhabdus wittichii DC-6]
MTRLNLDCPRECLPLQDWSANLVTRAGHHLHVRPVRDDDRGRLERFLHRVSAADRRFRFPAAAPATYADRIAAMIELDHETGEHFVGFLPHSDRIVASALLTGDRAQGIAGVAILLDRRFKNRGFGWSLLAHVARFARSHGYKRLVSIESGLNQGALAVEEDMGFTVTPIPGDKNLILVEAML